MAVSLCNFHFISYPCFSPINFISGPLPFPIEDLCPSYSVVFDHSLFDQDSSFLILFLFTLCLIFGSFLDLTLCCFSIHPISCILLILVFCSLLFVVLWVTVMGPKPARIKGNVFFTPFPASPKPRLRYNNSFFVCLLLSFPFSSLPTLSQFWKTEKLGLFKSCLEARDALLVSIFRRAECPLE